MPTQFERLLHYLKAAVADFATKQTKESFKYVKAAVSMMERELENKREQ